MSDPLADVRLRMSDDDLRARILRHDTQGDSGPLRFVVGPRRAVERGLLEVGQPYVLISLSDPGQGPPDLPEDADRRGALFLAFHNTLSEEGSRARAIGDDDVERVRAFLEAHADVRAFALHCNHGVFRSPAVAAAICAARGGDEQFFFRERVPNELVYERIRAALA